MSHNIELPINPKSHRLLYFLEAKIADKGFTDVRKVLQIFSILCIRVVVLLLYFGSFGLKVVLLVT